MSAPRQAYSKGEREKGQVVVPPHRIKLTYTIMRGSRKIFQGGGVRRIYVFAGGGSPRHICDNFTM